jgi:hypothetical protein
MKKEKPLYVQNVVNFLDMLPTDKEIEKVLKLVKAYSNLNVCEQQRINMFDYIRKHWNG